jgi:hypothetical protein
MTVEQIIEHIVISSLGWPIGISIGVAFGYAVAAVSLRIYPPHTPSPLWGTLFPWRTIVAGFFLLNLFLYIPVRFFGLGQDTGIISTSFAIVLCAAVLTVQTVRFTATPMMLRGISWLRSLAVLSVVVATHYGFYVGAGLGQVIQWGILLLDELEVGSRKIAFSRPPAGSSLSRALAGTHRVLRKRSPLGFTGDKI